MKVSELVIKLAKYDPDADVVFETPEGVRWQVEGTKSKKFVVDDYVVILF